MNDYSIVKEEIKKKEREDKEVMKYFNYRIRTDRVGRTVIDRYITNTNSMNPFDDNFNELILRDDSYFKSGFNYDGKL